jgi:Tfp pilus assembly protein PilE
MRSRPVGRRQSRLIGPPFTLVELLIILMVLAVMAMTIGISIIAIT